MSSATGPDVETVRVALDPGSYEVAIVHDGLDRFASFAERALGGAPAGLAVVVADEGLPRGLVDRHCEAIARVVPRVEVAAVPAGEESKSVEQWARLHAELIRFGADRSTLVTALGGGVVGDLAGFVAATHARGLRLLAVPTTLLAQVDSSVGGKTAINLPTGKNLVGAFHQPIGVWIDTASLDDLPLREFRAGLAEVVKYGAIRDEAFFGELEAWAEGLAERRATPDQLRRIVRRSCEIKAEVVGRDERDTRGVREALNFGHTIGHAIEAVAGYGALRHGEAVAIGMLAEARLAEGLGMIGAGEVDRLRALLRRLGLPLSAPGLDRDELVRAMRRDKKNQGGSIRFALPERIGSVRSGVAVGEGEIGRALEASATNPGA